MISIKYFIVSISLFVYCSAAIIPQQDFDIDQNDEIKPQEKLHPDVGLKVPQLVEKYGYPIENHTIETPDGYLLRVHRIPHGKNNAGETNKPVVFLMHGILASSADWVLMGPEKGLAYLLADLGYDVWMGNARGNTYSRKHVEFNPDKDKKKFWSFSWHEIGNIDLPSMIDYILEKTGDDNLFYIGHSQGTTSFFVMTSTRPEYNDKIRLMIALAPVAYMNHIPNLAFKIIAQFSGTLSWVTKFLGAYEFMPSSEFMTLIGSALCNDSSLFQDLCKNILFLIVGFDSVQLNKTMIPVMLSNTPAGSSTKQFIHFGQGVKSGDFKQYNYGYFKNKKIYGQSKPPKYELAKVTAPVVLFYGNNDQITDEIDIERLRQEISRPIIKYKVKHDKFNHLDFLWSIDVVPLLYNKIFEYLERF